MRSNWVSGLDQFDKLATIIILTVYHGTSLLGKQGAQRIKSAFSIVDITLHWTCGYCCRSAVGRPWTWAQDPSTCWMLRHCRLWDAVRLSLSAILLRLQDSRRFLPGTGLSDVAFCVCQGQDFWRHCCHRSDCLASPFVKDFWHFLLSRIWLFWRYLFAKDCTIWRWFLQGTRLFEVGLDSDLSQFYLEIVLTHCRRSVVRFLSVHRKSQVTVAQSYPCMEYNKYFSWDWMLYALARGNKMSITIMQTGPRAYR